MYEFCNEYEFMFKNIISAVYTYLIANNHIKSLIVGMSGGIDSALTAALAVKAIELFIPDNKIVVKGVVIDIESKKEEILRGIKAAEALCHDHRYINMEKSLYAITQDIELDRSSNDDIKTRIRIGNIKARLRMQCLYDIAKSTNGIVLSTDNYTEYLLGFWTLHGDVGDFGIIQGLWKTEVYGLANYLVKLFRSDHQNEKANILQEIIESMPTDGLGITDTDFDQIYPDADKSLSPDEIYNRIDTVLYNFIVQENNMNNEVVNRYKFTEFKRNNPFNIQRDHIIPLN